MRALIDRSQDTPRVGACTLHAPVSIELADAHSVALSWPAIGVDVDVIFLVHDGPLDARIRDRMAAGPAEFLVVPTAGDIAQAWSDFDPGRLERARMKSLWHGLASLGLEPPALPVQSGRGPASVCVISPRQGDRSRVADILNQAGYVCSASDAADIVVAVAPMGGWRKEDVEPLAEAFAKVGRLVSTAPLPVGQGIEAVVAAEEGVVAAVQRCLERPPLFPLPAVNPSAWERGAMRLERGTLSERSLGELLVITIVLGVGLTRLFPVGIAVLIAVILGAVRLWSRCRSKGSRTPAASIWLRRKLATVGSE
ncbi:hypothetical protein [Corynebacterium sp. H130]|uniref:hypothetical protein n=1 Tax=Corynebacterium sp. H130 TaxID=3133444 RepID=UPI003096B6A2